LGFHEDAPYDPEATTLKRCVDFVDDIVGSSR